jgi:tRNA dimethylallyltransferase
MDVPLFTADSRQFYREMNIGTAAPTKEEMGNIPHYFVGHLSIKDYYSVSRFEQDVLKLLPTLFQQTNTVIMTGGSGLYLDAVCYGMMNCRTPTLQFERRSLDYTKTKD